MKLHFIEAHRKIGPLRKTLGLPDGTDRSYPSAKTLKSHEESIDIQSPNALSEYKGHLANHAAKGHALFRGVFTSPLQWEYRSGKADKNAKTEFLVIDIDGLEVDWVRKGMKVDSRTVEQAAEHVLSLLPESLQTVSYVAAASSSFGIKDKMLSVHIHFLLDRPVEFGQLKDWLRGLNYSQVGIYDKLKLTPSKGFVKSIVDPCLAECGRIVYIAPPHFAGRIPNPFNNDKERFVLVKKDDDLLDVSKELDTLADKRQLIEAQEETKRKELQRAAGVSVRRMKMTRMRVGQHSISVGVNPNQIHLTYAFEDDLRVRYNCGGSTSAAYWVNKSNPEIVHSFYPDEPSMLFKVVDPEAYAKHVAKYGKGYEAVKDTKAGVERRISRHVFIEQNADCYVTVEYDENTHEVVDYRERRSGEVAEEYIKFHGGVMPDPVPPIYAVNDPTEKRGIYEDSGKTYINRFAPTKYMKLDTVHPHKDSLRYGTAWTLQYDCPLVSEIIYHMLGEDWDCFEHFINWFAYIFQFRDKAQTAWLLHGTEGTGKGLFYNEIASKLLGKYAVMNTLQNIADDKFNDWMTDALLVVVDEFNMNSTTSGVRRTAAQLRNLITEPTISLRKAFQGGRIVPQYLNFIFPTNDYDAMSVQDKRRYNVAYRQERMLQYRLPVIKSNWKHFRDDLLAPELEKFAVFLNNFKVHVSHATNILQNEAKRALEQSSMNAADRFFDILKNGEFAEFAPLLDKPRTKLDVDENMVLERVTQVLIASLPFINSGETAYYLKDDIALVYGYLSGKKISVNALGRMINSAGVKKGRSTKLVGYAETTIRQNCVPVNWKWDEPEILEMLKDKFVSIGTKKVTPFEPKQPDVEKQKQELLAEAQQLLEEYEA